MLKKSLIILTLLLGAYQCLPAQNYKFQSLFIYNIIKRIDWPTSSDNNIVIGVMGSKELYNELHSLAQKQKIAGKKVVIQEFNIASNKVDDIHVLYVARSSSSKIKEISTLLSSKPVLLISDKPGITGVGINFLDNTKGLKFEIFPGNIKSHQLSVANSLLTLGIIKE
jgi:hypothetical protein